MNPLPNTHQLIIFNLLVAMLAIYVGLDANPYRFALANAPLQASTFHSLITGNFYHANALHMIVNVLMTALVTALFRPKAYELALVFIASCAFATLTSTVNGLEGFCGLSATLHATFGYFALKGLLQGQANNGFLLVLLIIKIAHQLAFGNSIYLLFITAADVSPLFDLVGLYCGISLLLLKGFYHTLALHVTDRPRSANAL